MRAEFADTYYDCIYMHKKQDVIIFNVLFYESNYFALNIGLKRPNLPRFTLVLMTQKHLFKVYAALVVSMIFWSMTFVWYKDAYMYLKPMTTIFLRLLISSVFLYVFCKFTGKLQKIRREDVKLVLLMAFFEPFMYFMGESFGMQLVSPTVGDRKSVV